MSRQLRQATEERGALLKQADEILAIARSQKRELTPEESRKIETIKAGIFTQDRIIAHENAEIRSYVTGGRYDASDMREMGRFNLARAIRALSDGKPLDGIEGELHQEGRHLADSQGIAAKGNLILPLTVLAERRDMTATLQTTLAGDQGGNFVATDLAEPVPLLYSKSVLRALGARFLNGLIGNVAVPKLKTGAVATHKGETTALDESSPTTGQILMSPNRLGTFVEISKQLLHQSDMIADRLVRSDLMTTLALGIENGAINGTGSDNQPLGLLAATSGVNFDVAGGTDGAAPNWGHVLELEEKIASANADQAGTVGYLTNPKVRRVLKGTLKAATHHEFCWNGSTLNGYKAEVSTLIPSNGDKGGSTGVCSSLIFGNWDDLLIGIWGGIDIMVNPYVKDIEGLVRITGDVFYDTAIRRPESFAAMTDALTA
jgi:HK97 family phage major capsid protein